MVQRSGSSSYTVVKLHWGKWLPTAGAYAVYILWAENDSTEAFTVLGHLGIEDDT